MLSANISIEFVLPKRGSNLLSTKRWNPWTLKGKEKRKREREQEKKEIGEQRDEDFHKKGKTHIWEQ